MVKDSRKGALVAGLAGQALLWAMPTPAMAATATAPDPMMWGGMGLAAGVVAGGGCALALHFHDKRRFEARIAELEALMDRPPVVAGRHVAHGEPHCTLPNPVERPGRIDYIADSAVLPVVAVEPDEVLDETPQTAEPASSRELPTGAFDLTVDEEVERAVKAEKTEDVTATVDVEQLPEIEDVEPPVEHTGSLRLVSSGLERADQVALLAQEETEADVEVAVPDEVERVEKVEDATPAAEVPEAVSASVAEAAAPLEHTAVSETVGAVGEDYGEVADAYVRHKSFRERMLIRAKGVAAVLSERIGADAMEGLPVIERADGTVGDVGTSWWEASAEEHRRTIGRDFQNSFSQSQGIERDYVAMATEMTGPFDPLMTPQGHPRPSAIPGADLAPQAPSAAISADDTDPMERSISIARRVAPLEETAYPEAADEPLGDGWDAALAALDERFDDNLVAVRHSFSDFIGGPDTLDEPDGLEEPTDFLPFKPQANHPEAQSTAAYVDLLLGQEIARHGSSQVRAHAKRYLKVLEGGTGAMDLDDTKSRRA